LASIAGEHGREARRSVPAEHDSAQTALADLDRRMVVIVDDIDRLEVSQVRDVVRLIKLVADFPNITYLLAYDGDRVARALATGDLAEGRAYLEKIVQVSTGSPRRAAQPILTMAW